MESSSESLSSYLRSTSIINIVNNSDIRDSIYQIMVNCLRGNTPSMIVLPCLVQFSLIEGDECIEKINNLLTDLLMVSE